MDAASEEPEGMPGVQAVHPEGGEGVTPKALTTRYVTKKIIIDRKNLRWFKMLEHARPIRPDHVNSIYRALKAGQHFEAPLVVNDLSTADRSRYKLIDGSHRMEAIKKWIMEDVDASVEVIFHIYRGLSEEDERFIYEQWNRGKSASWADRIYVNQEDYPILAMMKKDFPAPVVLYGLKKGAKGFRFLTLLSAYKSRFAVGTTGVNTNDILNFAKSVGAPDHEYLKQYAVDFTEAFGDPTKLNVWNKFAPSLTLMKIYACNLDIQTLRRDEIVARWRGKVANDSMLRELAAVSGTGTILQLAENIVAAMNKGFPKRQAITPKEWGERRKANA